MTRVKKISDKMNAQNDVNNAQQETLNELQNKHSQDSLYCMGLQEQLLICQAQTAGALVHPHKLLASHGDKQHHAT